MEQSKVIGITFSTFDLLHAGHVAMLREAKEVCDYHNDLPIDKYAYFVSFKP